MTEKKYGKIFAAALMLVLFMNYIFFTAAFAAKAGNVALAVRQVFADDGASAPNETFSYRLTPKQPSNPMPDGSDAGGYTFTIAGTKNIEIGPINFAHPGIYAYEVACITEAAAGYALDRQLYAIEVHIKSDLAAAIVVYKNNGAKASEIYFGHSYTIAPSDPKLMVDPSVVKTVFGDPAQPSAFLFQLKAGDLSNPMPEGSQNGAKTISIVGSGRGEFGTWSYSKEGTYYYTVSELNTDISGYTYDAEVYTITDNVKAEDGQLVLNRIVTNSSNRQVSSFTYLNTYKSQGGSTTQPPPSTQPPSSTEAPTAWPPTIKPPATEPPATGQPATKPSTAEPQTEPPATENLTAENTAATKEPTATEEPATEDSIAENTTDDEPEEEQVSDQQPPGAGQKPDLQPPGQQPPKLPIGEQKPNWPSPGQQPPLQQSPWPRPPAQNGPKTGDESKSALYSALLCIAAFTAATSAAYLLCCRRRRKGWSQS